MRTDPQFKTEIYRRKALYLKKRQTRVVALSSAFASVVLCALTVLLIQDLTPAPIPPDSSVEGSSTVTASDDSHAGGTDGVFSSTGNFGSSYASDSGENTNTAPPVSPVDYVVYNGETMEDGDAVAQFLMVLSQVAPLPKDTPQGPTNTSTGTSVSTDSAVPSSKPVVDPSTDMPTDTSSDSAVGPQSPGVDSGPSSTEDRPLNPGADGDSTSTENRPPYDSENDGGMVSPPQVTTVFTVVTGAYRDTYRLEKFCITVNSVSYPITEVQYNQLISLLG